MERRDRNEGITDTRREVPLPVAPAALPTHPGHGEAERVALPLETRVRWGGVTSGWLMALGTLVLLTTLGLAIGVSAIGDPRTADSPTASGLGMGAGLWGAVTLLIAAFVGGLVSTRVTDRPDRGGAFLQGALVWTLTSLFLVWLVGQGVSLGLSGFFGALSGITRTAATAVTTTATQGGDLAQRFGLTDPTQVTQWLDKPETAALFASATGLAPEEARTTLAQFRGRIDGIRDNPEHVATEVRTFLAQYKERAEQQALRAAAAVQKGASTGAWVTFAVLTLMLLASVLGALAGVPNLRTWRARRAPLGAA